MAEKEEKEGPHGLPLARVKLISSQVSDSMSFSNEALFALSKAAELFIEGMAKGVHSKYGNQIDYDELAAFIQEHDEIDFLHDFFPQRMTFKEAVTKTQNHNNN